jgi:hypothetical protein
LTSVGVAQRSTEVLQILRFLSLEIIASLECRRNPGVCHSGAHGLGDFCFEALSFTATGWRYSFRPPSIRIDNGKIMCVSTCKPIVILDFFREEFMARKRKSGPADNASRKQHGDGHDRATTSTEQ